MKFSLGIRVTIVEIPSRYFTYTSLYVHAEICLIYGLPSPLRLSLSTPKILVKVLKYLLKDTPIH